MTRHHCPRMGIITKFLLEMSNSHPHALSLNLSPDKLWANKIQHHMFLRLMSHRPCGKSIIFTFFHIHFQTVKQHFYSITYLYLFNIWPATFEYSRHFTTYCSAFPSTTYLRLTSTPRARNFFLHSTILTFWLK